jgi:hypothetical protein
MITHYENYLYSVELDTIDNKLLINNCLDISDFLIRSLPQVNTEDYGNLTSSYHGMYNLLTFPHIELNKLYHEMITHISPVLEKETYYMIKSWLNVYQAGQRINWHGHWPAPKRAWHGFYCAQVGDNASATHYKIPGSAEIITVPSKDGRLVFGKSDGDEHSSSEWKDKSMPRLTLAFDIIPTDSINDKLAVNHYLPFKKIL